MQLVSVLSKPLTDSLSVMDDSLPVSPDSVHWKRERGKDVSQWRYLGTRTLEGHGPVEFRARLHRYDGPDGFRYEPLVQYRTEEMNEWAGSLRKRNVEHVLQMVHTLLDCAKRITSR